MERTDGVLIITGVLRLVSTSLGALSFYGPGETDFVPSVLRDLDFMPVHEGRDVSCSRVGEASAKSRVCVCVVHYL